MKTTLVLLLVAVCASGAARAQDSNKSLKAKGGITHEMQESLNLINQVSGRDKQERGKAVDKLHDEIAKFDPKVFIPLAIPHLMRLAPTDTRTQTLLRRALDKSWLEPFYARAMLVRSGDPAEPHIKEMIKALDDPDSAVRLHAIGALSHCGYKANTALPRLQQIVEKAKADPSDYERAYNIDSPMPEHVEAYWVIKKIKSEIKERQP